jgi:hypothetical protein
MTDPVRSLARWCSLAVLAEPGLVRSFRLKMEPELDASAEADLWWSPLVESRTTRGIVLEASAAAEFRDELRALHQDHDKRPGEAWELVQAHHRGLTPAVALEEEIAWLWVSLPEPGPEIEKRLRTVLAAVISEGRTALGPWAGRAIPRLPGIARKQPSAWYLEQEALAQLPHLSALETQPPEQVDLAVLALMSGRLRRAVLGTLRVGDRLYLGAVGSSGESIEVPATDPRVVEVIRTGGTSAAAQVPVGGLERIDVGWGPVSIRTRFGDVYDLPVWDGLDRDRLGSSVVNLFGGQTGPVRLGVVVGENLVATTADVPLLVQPLDGERRLASTVVRRQGDLTLLRVDQLGTRESLPVRRLRRPPGRGRRWYGWPEFAGLIREPVFSDIPASPILMQARNPSVSPDETAAPGGPIVVDGEISGLVTSLVPGADFGGDGDLSYGNWSDLWALMYPEAAQAPARRWLTALADVVQALCLDLHTRFRPLGEVQPVNGQFTDQQGGELRWWAEAIVNYAVASLFDGTLLPSDPALLARSLPDLPATAVAELTTADPRQPTAPLDPGTTDAVLAGLARQDDQDLTHRLTSLLTPAWRTARNKLADLHTPGFSRQQDLVSFLAALSRAYGQMFASLGERYGTQLYRTNYRMARENLAILAPLRQFEVEQISSPGNGECQLEGRFAEITAVFEWAFTELIDAVAAFDPRSEQDDEDRDAGQAPPDAEPAVCYLIAQSPERVQAGSHISLLLWTTYAPGDGASVALRPLDMPIEGRDVTLIVSPIGLESLDDLQQHLHVPATGDSQPIRFAFTAASAGLQRIAVRAFANGTLVGELQLEISVEARPTGGTGRSRDDDVGVLAAAPGEVTLQVQRDADGQYTFQLLSESLYQAERSRGLAGDPVRAVAAIAGEFAEMAAKGYPTALVRNRLRNLGAQLWADLIPQEIRRQFWAQADRIRSFTIYSDVDVVPWELLYPIDGDNDNGFLVEQFPVVRRVYGEARVRELRLGRAAYVVPPGGPATAMEEVRAVRSRLGTFVRDLGIVDRLDSLIGLFDDAPNVLHFAGHTHVVGQRGTEITLAGGSLRPVDLTAQTLKRGLATASTLVFFNACRAEDETLGFVQMADWASRFMAAGAGAFLGPLWPVRASSARAFADAFYQALVSEGATLGAATQRARRSIAADDGDPAWLAYTVYGDPSATVFPDPSALTDYA